MMVVDERILHDNTIIRIGEEHGILKLKNETKIEYILRIIQELQEKPKENWNLN